MIELKELKTRNVYLDYLISHEIRRTETQRKILVRPHFLFHYSENRTTYRISALGIKRVSCSSNCFMRTETDGAISKGAQQGFEYTASAR